jgi:hypothetical protein
MATLKLSCKNVKSIILNKTVFSRPFPDFLTHKKNTQNIKVTALEYEETIYYGTLACIINKSKTSTLQSSFGIYLGCNLQKTEQDRKVCSNAII